MKKKNNQNNNFFKVFESYAVIPKLYDRENKQHRFTGNMKLAYSTILSFEANKQKAYFSIAHLCGLCSLSDSNARKMLSLMESLGLIKREKRPGMTDTYSTMPITDEMINGYHGLTAVNDDPLPVEICEAMPEQETRIKAAVPPGSNEQPDNEENADMLDIDDPDSWDEDSLPF